MNKITTAMYAFGEVSWEIDAEGRKVFAGTWRVGDPDGGANSPDAEPGMLMPATFKVEINTSSTDMRTRLLVIQRTWRRGLK
jgi:hypothetical protein